MVLTISRSWKRMMIWFSRTSRDCGWKARRATAQTPERDTAKSRARQIGNLCYKTWPLAQPVLSWPLGCFYVASALAFTAIVLHSMSFIVSRGLSFRKDNWTFYCFYYFLRTYLYTAVTKELFLSEGNEYKLLLKVSKNLKILNTKSLYESNSCISNIIKK